ncbi:hypothetical protein Pyn_33594 [Prunus yedoensis var. nudiflora]|uniref:Uncharacterized protein n=2 Tax=Prunus TaxID=3754 RepID=A0A6J5XZF7_PRUAR|nr:hypothetical protein Pyn_33594 [Prunus yedoensis var. nudiflora]CAB4286144.1 unnamed protein product [Prunus armeniaca]CAB4316578.1 unnamed protein product [Prunus armeniaca]
MEEKRLWELVKKAPSRLRPTWSSCMIARRPSNGRGFVTRLLCKGNRGEGREYKFVYCTRLAYGSDIDIGRSGPSLLLDFDDLPAGGSSKVGERDRKLTRVGGRGAVYIYSNRGDSSTRQMGERSNRAGGRGA